jgi:sec-independent protein translocase protein TatC
MIKSEQIVGLVHTLEKYRNEILRMFVMILAITTAVYFNSGLIIDILSKSLNNLPLFFFTPMDGFIIKMKISAISGILLSLPIVICRIVFLTSDRISKKNRKLIYFVICPFSVLFFIFGALFAYKIALPTTIEFLISSGDKFMKPTLSGRSYFSFVTVFIAAIGGVFELPLVFVALSRIGIVTYKLLSSKRKIAMFLIIIIAALITPTPDIFSLIIVSLPMIVLYEISIWWILILEKYDIKRELVK